MPARMCTSNFSGEKIEIAVIAISSFRFIFFQFKMIFNLFLIQKQISSTLWPSDAYLPKVSARYGHDDATEPDYVQHEVNVAINLDEHDVDGVKGKLMERYMKYVSKNLLEVR